MHVAQELVANLDKLASLPSIYYRVRQALDEPDVSLTELAELIGSEPALSFAVLRLANSAMYGFPRHIESVSRAIQLTGLSQVNDLVLAASIAATFGGIRPQRMDMARFWRSSVRCALLCRAMGEIRKTDGERMFLLGLLSDMGHLVMYHAIPDLADVVLETSGLSLDDLAAREREVIGCDFAEVGVALSSSWQLPVVIGVTIGAQLQPTQAGEHVTLAAMLNLARHIDEHIEAGVDLEQTVARLSPDTLALAGIDIEALPIAAEQCETELKGMLQSLGLPTT